MNPVSRSANAALRRAKDVALRLRLVSYRPTNAHEVEAWNQDYLGGVSEEWTGLRHLPRYSVIAGYIRFLADKPSILEIGCGTGILLQQLDESAFERYVGTDIAEEAIARARSRERQRTEFILTDLPHANAGRFDIVVCNEVLYYVTDLEELLQRIHDLLRPGGYLITSTWRQPMAVGLDRLLDETFAPLDAVLVKHAHVRDRSLRWRVACHRRR